MEEVPITKCPSQVALLYKVRNKIVKTRIRWHRVMVMLRILLKIRVYLIHQEEAVISRYRVLLTMTGD